MLSALERPGKMVLRSMTGIAYLFALAAVGAMIAWIYYVAKAVEADEIGEADGQTSGPVVTADVMFQGTVIAVLVYFAFRHNFRCHY